MSTRSARSETAERTAARLIATARHAFAEQGFAQVSLEALAAEAGVTRGALHHHFTNKAGLFEAVLRAVDAEIGAELDRIHDREPDLWQGFRACFHAYLVLALRPDRRRILFHDAPAVLGSRALDILMNSGFATIVADLRRLIENGRIRQIPPEALAHTLNGAVMAQVMWLSGLEGDDPTRLAAAHDALDAIFDGLTVQVRSHDGGCLPS